MSATAVLTLWCALFLINSVLGQKPRMWGSVSVVFVSLEVVKVNQLPTGPFPRSDKIGKISIRRGYRTFSVFLPIFKRPIDYMSSKAVIDAQGSYTHGGLLNSARILAKEISASLKGRKQERVAYFIPPTAESVIITWAIWISGQVAVPLSCEQTQIAHEYFIVDSEPNLIVVTEELNKLGAAVRDTAKCPILVMSPELREKAMCSWVQDPKNPENTLIDDSSFRDLKLADLGQNDSFYRKASALIIYTSGSTPKGVVFSHTSLHAQVASLVDAWRLSKRDCFLQAEPSQRSSMLIMYLAPLTVGARVIMLDRLNPENIWINILGLRKNKDERPNIILTKSQIFPKLMTVYEKCLRKSDVITDHIRNKCLDQIRFFSVGNSPITRKISKLWEDITGHQVSSHFSITETGMVMSTPIYGCKSSSSSVGMPMPGVHVRLTNENGVGLVAEGSRAGTRILGNTQPVTGLLEVRGENILSGYWRKPTITLEALTRDGWFKTNDLVKYSRGMYSIIGQADTNVYRRGDLRYSIPLIEAILLNNEQIKEVAVLENRLLQDTKLLALVVTGGPVPVSLLQDWVKNEIPDLPIEIELVKEIPKNWSGKKNRQKILELYDQQLKNQYLKENDKKRKDQTTVADNESLRLSQSSAAAAAGASNSVQPG